MNQVGQESAGLTRCQCGRWLRALESPRWCRVVCNARMKRQIVLTQAHHLHKQRVHRQARLAKLVLVRHDACAVQAGQWHYKTWSSWTCHSTPDEYEGVSFIQTDPATRAQQDLLQEYDDGLALVVASMEEAQQGLRNTPGDTLLQHQYNTSILLKSQFERLRRKTKATLALFEGASLPVSMADIFQLPLPDMPYRPPSTPPETDEVSGPVLVPEVWEAAEQIISSKVDTFLAKQTNHKRYQCLEKSYPAPESEAGVASGLGPVMNVVQRALKQADVPSMWTRLGPQLGSQEAEEDSKTELPVVQRPQEELVIQGPGSSKRRPAWEMFQLGGPCRTFFEVKTSHVLSQAGTKSLASLLAVEAAACGPGRRPADAAFRSAQRLVSNVLGQVEAYCRERRVRYFGITTYQVTWVGKIEKNRMFISHGFPSEGTTVTTLKVLLWLSLMGMEQDAMLEADELPPRDPQPSQRSAADTPGTDGATSAAPNTGDSPHASGAASTPTAALKKGDSSHVSTPTAVPKKGDSPHASGAADSGNGPTAEDSSTSSVAEGELQCNHYGSCTEAVQWYEELPSHPGSGVLGTGITGDVLLGRLGTQPVAVKWADSGSDLEDALGWEAQAYLDLVPLQGKVLPTMLYCGPASGNRYVVVLSLVPGRELRAGGVDSHLLPLALQALRALHQAGYLHGDIRPANLMVVDEKQAPRVVLVDLGCATRATCEADKQAEEQELILALTGLHPATTCTPDSLSAGVPEGLTMLQNLPSIVAALALSPSPGSRVLDMCAAPGGKTTLLAQIMGDQGEIIALDRTHAKAQEIMGIAAERGAVVDRGGGMPSAAVFTSRVTRHDWLLCSSISQGSKHRDTDK